MAEGEHEGVAGLWSVIGQYSVDLEKPDRQVTHFTNLRMEPQDTSPEGLKAWLDFAKSSNPNMVRSLELCFINSCGAALKCCSTCVVPATVGY